MTTWIEMELCFLFFFLLLLRVTMFHKILLNIHLDLISGSPHHVKGTNRELETGKKTANKNWTATQSLLHFLTTVSHICAKNRARGFCDLLWPFIVFISDVNWHWYWYFWELWYGISPFWAVSYQYQMTHRFWVAIYWFIRVSVGRAMRFLSDILGFFGIFAISWLFYGKGTLVSQQYSRFFGTFPPRSAFLVHVPIFDRFLGCSERTCLTEC